MKKLILMTLVSGFSLSALASHPHDRVCVNSSPVSFVVQYSVGRTYQQGDPNKDPHVIALEALYSAGDYMVMPSKKFVSEEVKFTKETVIPVTLKATDGAILFKGKFDRTKETLSGTFVNAEGRSIQGTAKLTCISQPRLKLETAEEDLVN